MDNVEVNDGINSSININEGLIGDIESAVISLGKSLTNVLIPSGDDAVNDAKTLIPSSSVIRDRIKGNNDRLYTLLHAIRQIEKNLDL